MKGKVLSILTFMMQVVFSIPIYGMYTLLIPSVTIIAIVLHTITIIVLQKKQQKVVGNYIGILAALFTTIYMLVIFINGTELDNQAWAMLFLIISWPLHIASGIIIFITLVRRVNAEKSMNIEKE